LIPRQRVLAWLIDCAGILGWLALTVAVGLVLRQLGVRPGPLGTNVLATVFGVAPVCLGLAIFESGRREATPGKRRRHLVVVSTNQYRRIGLGRALVRNLLKVGLPWTLGHALAIALVGGATFTARLVVLAALAYAVPIFYLITLLAPPHRPVYDRLSGTNVVARTG